MAMPRRWADLHIGTVTEIVNRVPCGIDRARMAAVCQAWLEAVVQAPPPPRRLPSLLLAPADGTGAYCYLSGGCDHNRFPGPRHFGSYDGGWLFLAYRQTYFHRLLNIRTGESHILPDVIFDDDNDYSHYDMVVLATTLSFPPDDLGCAAAGIVAYQPGFGAPSRRSFAFWRLGDWLAFCDVEPAGAVPVGPGMELEDVVHYRLSFHFLTQGGHILVCRPIWNDGIRRAKSKLKRFQGSCGDDPFVVRARYLVESRGELLMVVRLAPHHHEATSSFKVFRSSCMTPMNIMNPDDDGEEEEADEYPRTWIELAALDGRMLFVGRGCSRSYEVGQYPGFKDGIFFLDDRSFYDDEMMFGGVNERQYPAATSAGGRRNCRLPTSTSTSRSGLLPPTLLRLGFSLDTAGLRLRNL